MKGTFKESEIEIEVIDLSGKTFFGEKNFEKEIVNDKKEYEQTAKDLVAQNKAMKTSIALLEKCLDEATEDRDRYKRQLDELNIMFDEYIRREKQIKGVGSCKTCLYRNLYKDVCDCNESDNYGERVDSECRCERYKPNA